MLSMLHGRVLGQLVEGLLYPLSTQAPPAYQCLDTGAGPQQQEPDL